MQSFLGTTNFGFDGTQASRLLQTPSTDSLKEGISQAAGNELASHLDMKRRTEQNIRLLVHVILRPDDSLHRHAVDKYYAPSAELLHPVLGPRFGRNEILQLYLGWSRLHRLLGASLSATVHTIRIADDLSSAIVEIRQRALMFNNILVVDMHMYCDLRFSNVEGGILISKQIDVWTLDGMLSCLFGVRHLYVLYQYLYRNTILPVLLSVINMLFAIMLSLNWWWKAGGAAELAFVESGGLPAVVMSLDE